MLQDRPALAGAEALWAAHVARTVAQLGRLRVGLPRPGLAAHDQRALRGLLAVALAACLVIAGSEAPAAPAARRAAGICGAAGAARQPVAGLDHAAGLYRARAGVPEQRGRGGQRAGGLAPDGERHRRQRRAEPDPGRRVAAPFQALDRDSFQADVDLAAGGRLAVRRGGREIAGWDLTVVADAAPVVFWPQPPGPARGGGRMPQTRLPWQVSHDYGVASLNAELRLRDRPDAPALVVPIPLPGGSPKSARGARVQDLTAHPWAGLAVIGQLVARDAPGLTGTSAEASFVLPERAVPEPGGAGADGHPQATDPEARRPADAGRRTSTGSRRCPRCGTTTPAGSSTCAASPRCWRAATAAAAVDEAQARLWELAIHLEEGATERTARALEQARQALREALEAQQRGEKTDPAELDRRMKDVQDALAEPPAGAGRAGAAQPRVARHSTPTPTGATPRDMQRLAEQMREAAREGQMDEARDEFAELEQMLDEMKNMPPDRGRMTERERQRAEQRQRGQQQMNALQDIVQRLGTLLDHAESRGDTGATPVRTRVAAAMKRRHPAGPAGGRWWPRLRSHRAGAADPGRRRPPSSSARATARTQQALRRVLGVLMQQYGDLTGKVPESLNDADIAMREAVQALEAGDDAAAAAAIQKAIEALQKGGRSMSQQLAQQFGRQQDQGAARMTTTTRARTATGRSPAGQDGSAAGRRPGRAGSAIWPPLEPGRPPPRRAARR